MSSLKIEKKKLFVLKIIKTDLFCSKEAPILKKKTKTKKTKQKRFIFFKKRS